jgi:hypothetical protein
VHRLPENLFYWYFACYCTEGTSELVLVVFFISLYVGYLRICFVCVFCFTVHRLLQDLKARSQRLNYA